jgi:hypothetical protein
LLNLIPDEELNRLAVQTGVDHWASILYGKSMFYLLLYGLADSDKTSLRSLEAPKRLILCKPCKNITN